MMGSRGPKISSVMIAESSGGFSSIVGSMHLKLICGENVSHNFERDVEIARMAGFRVLLQALGV
jgi:hypothetical protein